MARKKKGKKGKGDLVGSVGTEDSSDATSDDDGDPVENPLFAVLGKRDAPGAASTDTPRTQAIKASAQMDGEGEGMGVGIPGEGEYATGNFDQFDVDADSLMSDRNLFEVRVPVPRARQSLPPSRKLARACTAQLRPASHCLREFTL